MNALAAASSTYLRQHASDPVDWQPWNAASLESAHASGKLIFVSSGYASCHWCHVMQDEVFSQPDVAQQLNPHFVCIKIDREELPELDAQLYAFQQQVSSETGWPLNVWLTPEGKPLFAAAGMSKPHFLRVCQMIIDRQRQDPELLLQAGTEFAAGLSAALAGKSGILDATALARALDQELAAADKEWGGVSGPRKFLLPSRWRLAVASARFSPSPPLEAQLRLTLDRIADGAIFDQLGGGVHRYTEDVRWLQPHFEKMLSDNAQLASLYFEAAAAFDEPRYRKTGVQILDFMLRDLRAPEGAFCSTLSAVDAAGEGAYYKWTAAELAAAAGADGALLARLLGVALPEAGAQDAPVLLNRRVDTAGLAAGSGRSIEELHDLVERYRPALLQQRAKRARPAVDPKLVSAWNGMALSALVQGFWATGEQRYLEAARAAADATLAANTASDGDLLRATTEGLGEQAATTIDYACLASGLFDLYQASGEDRWLTAGLDLLARQSAAEAERASAGLPGLQAVWAGQDGPEPSPGAALVHALLQAAILTGKAEFEQRAAGLLEEQGGSVAAAGIEAAWWLHATLLLDKGLHSVVLAGAPEDPARAAMVETLAKLAAPNAFMLLVPAVGPDAVQLARQPLLADKTALQGRTTAYVCDMSSCRLPTQSPVQLAAEVRAACGLAD